MSVVKDPSPQEQNATLSDLKLAWGAQNTFFIDQSYINMVQYHALLQTKAKNKKICYKIVVRRNVLSSKCFVNPNFGKSILIKFDV